MSAITAKLLDPQADVELFRQAWDFWLDYPPWFQEMDPRLPWEEYIAQARRPIQFDLGLFEDGKLVGNIWFVDIVPGHCEITTHAVRGFPAEIMQRFVYWGGLLVFEYCGFQEVFAWIPSMHWRNRRMAEASGQVWDGMRLIRATALGKPVTWYRYSMKRHIYEDYHRTRLVEAMEGVTNGWRSEENDYRHKAGARLLEHRDADGAVCEPDRCRDSIAGDELPEHEVSPGLHQLAS